MTMEYESNSPEDTMAFAEKLAQQAKPGDIICLSGPMGAGKTAFAQGYARGLGFDGYVNSPTFTLMQIYEGGRIPLYHFDLYRLEGQPEALDDIGFLDYLETTDGWSVADGCPAASVSLIEWPEYAGDIIPADAIWVKISVVEDLNCKSNRRSDDGSFANRRKIHVFRL